MARRLTFPVTRWIFIFLLLVAAVPAFAMLPSTPEPTESAAPVEQTIAVAPETNSDARIEGRIKGIFAELPDFEGVSVNVKEGVVTLTGTVQDEASITRAKNIVGRVAGVVTVENKLERDLSVDSNMGTFAKVAALGKKGLDFLPLAIVAIITALAVALLGYLIASFGAFWNRVTPNIFLSDLIRSAIRFSFVIGGVILALDILGASSLMGAVLGGAGVIGIALGFAMRETVENYVASLMLSLRQPFRANDHVLVDSYEGRVIRLTSRATILMTLDGNHLRIPNAQVFKAVILNYTTNPQRRLDFQLGIDGDDDPRAAMKLGNETLRAMPFILNDPPSSARIVDVGDSNIVINFLAWIDQRDSDFYKSRSLAIVAVKDALEQAGFALPEPIYRLRFDGRTDPLPIGRSASATASAPPEPRAADAKPSPATSADAGHDVRPESEIAEMVEKERAADGEQGNDLLDSGRPTE